MGYDEQDIKNALDLREVRNGTKPTELGASIVLLQYHLPDFRQFGRGFGPNSNQRFRRKRKEERKGKTDSAPSTKYANAPKKASRGCTDAI